MQWGVAQALPVPLPQCISNQEVKLEIDYVSQLNRNIEI